MSIGGFRTAREIMAQPAFRPYLKVERLPGPDVQSDAEVLAYARQHGKTDYHPVGTCKMGVDQMAVVDPELKLRGIERLRVCDSSTMPRHKGGPPRPGGQSSCSADQTILVVVVDAKLHIGFFERHFHPTCHRAGT